MPESLLTITDTSIYIFTQFVLYFAPGYLLLRNQLKSVPFFIRVPLYLSLGMLVVTIVLSVVGIFHIGNSPLIVIAISSYVIMIVRFLLSKWYRLKHTLKVTLKSDGMFTSIVSLIVLFAVTISFSNIAGYYGWPPIWDPVIHGFLTSLLNTNQHLQTTLSPVAPQGTWSEPFGFHVLASNLSFTFDLFPGAALLVLSTTIMSLITLLVFATTYLMTRSIIFALIALLSTFYVSSIPDLNAWLLGYYYDGTYAFLFGLLALMVFMNTEFVLSHYKKKDVPRVSLPTLVPIISMLLIYPPLCILPLLSIIAANIFLMAKKFGLLSKETLRIGKRPSIITSVTTLSYRKLRKLKVAKSFLLAAAIPLVILFTYLEFGGTLIDFQEKIAGLMSRTFAASDYYTLEIQDYFGDEIAPLTLLVMTCAVISVIKRQFVYMSLFYLSLSTLILLSLWDSVSTFFWFLLTKRLFMFLIIIDWIMLFTYLQPAIQWLLPKIYGHISPTNKILNKKLIYYGSYALIVIPLAMLVVPDALSNLNLEQAKQWTASYPRSESFRNDYPMLTWISEHISQTDLIMVPSSPTSYFIYSFSIKNLTAPISPANTYYKEMGLDNIITWERPELLKQFIDKYHVKYVLVLNTGGYLNPGNLGGDGRPREPKYITDEYLSVFNKMPFLDPIQKFGKSTLFEVKDQQREVQLKMPNAFGLIL